MSIVYILWLNVLKPIKGFTEVKILSVFNQTGHLSIGGAVGLNITQ